LDAGRVPLLEGVSVEDEPEPGRSPEPGRNPTLPLPGRRLPPGRNLEVSAAWGVLGSAAAGGTGLAAGAVAAASCSCCSFVRASSSRRSLSAFSSASLRCCSANSDYDGNVIGANWIM
jgi:hypothetical protein